MRRFRQNRRVPRWLIGAAALAMATPVAVAAWSSGAASQEITSVAASSAASCGGRVTANPFRHTESRSNCSVVGSRGFRQMYVVKVEPGTNAAAQVQVLGIVNGRPRWFNVGVLSGGRSARLTVPWGNVATFPKIRAKSVPPLFANVSWDHGT